MGGLSIGVFWGALVSAIGLAALSLSSPLPARTAAVEVSAAAPMEEVAAPDVVEDADPVEPEAAAEEAVSEPAVEPEVAPAVEPVTEPAADPAAAEDATPDEAASPATEIPLPSGSEFNRPPPEVEAALPTPDAAPSVIAPRAPVLSGDVTAPSFDTATAAQPDVGAQSPAPIAALAANADAPARPATSAAPAIANGPTALTPPDTSATPQVRTARLPQITAPEAAPEVAVDPEPVPFQTPVFPNIGDAANPSADAPDLPEDIATEGGIEAPSEEIAAVTTPTVTPTVTAPEVPVVGRLPQVSAEAEGETPAAAVADEPVPDGPLPAIQANAEPFDDTEDRPLMAIVLIDEPDSRIELSTLTRFSFPVAFAIDPLHPDAAERARAYRDAGFEVVILGSMIPDGATAADFEVAFAAALDTVPEAVALIDTPEGRIQGDRPVLNATVAALSESGHGLLAFPRGLNAAEQSASRVGVPGATLFRLLDDEDQRATVITRFLGRAAFTATQDGTVIVAGRTRPDTVTALFSWALGGRSEGVALAPLSATLLRASEQ